MTDKSFYNELSRALFRSDAAELLRILEVYRCWSLKSDNYPSECDEVMASAHKDPEIALALVILAAANFDDPEFLRLMAAGTLEELLRKPSQDMLDRIIAEARKTERFRWMLSAVYNHAIEPEDVRLAISDVVGKLSCETDPLPPRPFA